MKRLLLVFVTTFTTLVLSQEKIQIIDSQTKEPIGFTTIAFGEGLGGFTDEEGCFTFDKKQSFSVNMLGYKALFVSEADFRNSIELEIEPILIDEIIVSNKKGKQKISNQKPYWKNSTWLDSYTPQIGNEIAVLIPNDKKEDMILSKIIIPIATNPHRVFDKKSKGHFKHWEDLPYSTVRIRFYSNENNKPKEILSLEEIIVNVPNTKEKLFEVDLEKYFVQIPQNGLFVGIEFIGFADENQKYAYRPNFHFTERNGQKIKVATQMAICIPIETKTKTAKTFIRYSDWNKNGEKMIWQVFTEEIFLKLRQERERRKGTVNLGLGYELKVYE